MDQMEKVGRHSKVQDTKNSKLEKKNINKKSNKKDKNDSKSKNNFNEFGMAGKYQNQEKEKKPKKALKIVLSILLILFLIMGTVFGTYLYKAGGSFTGAVMNLMKDTIADKDPIFVLIMGVSEDISAELTDTIMLAGFNPETNQAFILSIPRDTFVGSNEATAGGFDKINALYQKSPQKTVEAVENLTGINIDYYITVKTSALIEIVDAIGGVDFDVPINMDYDDDTQDLHIHLKAGQQKINGEKAEQLVRFRHNNNGTTYSAEYGDNDEGRMKTQREFLKAIATQVVQWNNIDKVKEITNAIFKNLKTDITLSKILGYVPYATSFDVNNLEMDQLPGTPEKINELWFYKADSSETSELINGYIQKLGLDDKEKAKYIKTNVKKTKTTKSKNTTTKNETVNKKNTVVNQTKNTTNNTIKNTVKSKNETKNQSVKNEKDDDEKKENTIKKENTVQNKIENGTNDNNKTNENTEKNNTESKNNDTDTVKEQKIEE
ncbi:cell envelope-related function transcriptional attenuator common domain protein [Clostridium sp. CAG:492]|nr:cell envelope-related function transcriptional attenuator common domain protein [Clostridium sp. CAG:492]